jgi:methionyl aminopeptidase
MTIADQGDVDGLRRIGAIVAEARDTMGASVAPGITTAELDAIGLRVLQRHGARSAPRLAYGFPGTTCISVNDELAHGIPSAQRTLREGDLVNIDVSAELDGYWADTGASFPVGEIDRTAGRLLRATRAALVDAISVARAGAPIRSIGRAVERRAKRCRLRVVPQLCGHGVGRHIHEEPTIPNTPRGNGAGNDRSRLWEGLSPRCVGARPRRPGPQSSSPEDTAVAWIDPGTVRSAADDGAHGTHGDGLVLLLSSAMRSSSPLSARAA